MSVIPVHASKIRCTYIVSSPSVSVLFLLSFLALPSFLSTTTIERHDSNYGNEISSNPPGSSWQTFQPQFRKDISECNRRHFCRKCYNTCREILPDTCALAPSRLLSSSSLSLSTMPLMMKLQQNLLRQFAQTLMESTQIHSWVPWRADFDTKWCYSPLLI